MRLCSFMIAGRPGFGLVEKNEIIDLTNVPALDHTATLRDALSRFSPEDIQKAARSGQRRALNDVILLPPIPDAQRIICVGLNYREHAHEAGLPLPDRPSLFVRFASSFVGANGQIQAPNVSKQFDYEGEIALIIGRETHRVKEKDALDHVLGLTIAADNSIRDWQTHSRQATAGKNFYASGAIGPWCTTLDDIGDITNLMLETRLNGTIVQRGSSSDFIFSPQQLIEYISTFTPLSVGDMILLGTPAGVGMSRKPPLWLERGDKLEITVDRIGTLAMNVVPEQHPVSPADVQQ